MIFIEDGNIKVGGVVLPGLFKSIEISQQITIDEQDVEGSNKKAKQVTGYEDADISIELVLDDSETETKYQKLAAIQAVFRKPGQSLPTVYDIVNEDTAARNISRVIFKNLSHKKQNTSEQLPVTLQFTTYNPPTITATSSSGSNSSSSSQSADSGNSENVGSSGKLDKSPAVDE